MDQLPLVSTASELEMLKKELQNESALIQKDFTTCASSSAGACLGPPHVTTDRNRRQKTEDDRRHTLPTIQKSFLWSMESIAWEQLRSPWLCRHLPCPDLANHFSSSLCSLLCSEEWALWTAMGFFCAVLHWASLVTRPTNTLLL